MVAQKRSSTVTTTSCPILLSHLTASSHSPHRGTTPFVSGTSTPVSLPAVSWGTPQMCSPFLSLLITGKSSVGAVIAQSSFGTLLASANSTSRRRGTRNGTSIFHGRALVDCLNFNLLSIRVSCVRFSPNSSNPVIVSCGWDKVVKVGDLTLKF